MIQTIKKITAVFLALLMMLLCACAQGSPDDNTVTRGKKDTFTPSGQKVESSIFGRNIKYDGFTPAENMSLPIDSADILDMLQIEKTLYFLTDGAVYTLELESGVSGKLFDTDATMFATYGDTLYTYAPESGKLCAYSAGGEVISETVIALQNEKLDVEDMFVTDDYYSFKCKDKSGAYYVKQYNAFDRETLEQVNSFNEKASSFEPLRVYSSYKGNSLLKIEESPADSRFGYLYEIDLETGKFTRLLEANVDFSRTNSAFVYNKKTDTVIFFVAPRPFRHALFNGQDFSDFSDYDPEHDVMYISEYSLSDPDNIVHKRFYPDESLSDKVFVSIYENVVSAISSADNEYRCFDYLDPPESITFACSMADRYADILYGFESETGIMVRTVDYGYDFDRLDIKLMAGDTDFDLFAPIYMHQHKYLLAGMFEDLSKYEGLKQRLDSDLSAGYVSSLDGKYVGIPIYIQQQWTKEDCPEDGSKWTYSLAISRQLYLAQNIDVAEGVFKDPDGEEFYKLLKYLYDNPEGNAAKMPFGKEINVLDNEFVLMNPSSAHKENAAKFLEYMFDAFSERYADIDSTDDWYIYWRYFAPIYTNPITDAILALPQCDGKNSTLKEMAREAAAQVRMRLME